MLLDVPLRSAESHLAGWTSCESMCDPRTQTRKVRKKNPAARAMHDRTKVVDGFLLLFSVS
jgi:hypothetical protein